MAWLRPAASKSLKNAATAPTSRPCGSSNRYGSHFDPVADSDPTAATSNTDRSRASSKSSNTTQTVKPVFHQYRVTCRYAPIRSVNR